MTSPSHRPSRISSVLALGAGITVILVGQQATFTVLVVASAGLLAFAAGLVRGSRGWLAVGSVGFLGAIVVAGLVQLSSTLVFGGVIATMVAWDLGEYSIGVGEQLGRQAKTGRQELVHASICVGVGIIAVGIVLALRRLMAGSLPLSAFVIGLFAMLVLIAALRT